jgi:hypothetical protein
MVGPIRSSMERTVLFAHALEGAHAVTSLAVPGQVASPLLVTIPDLWLTFIIGTVLPAVVALVTSRFADSAVKAGVLVLLSVVGGVLVQIQASGGTFDLVETLVAVFMTFVTAAASHFALLKPVGVTGSEGAIARSVPGGLGSDARTQLPATSGTPSPPVGQPSRLYRGVDDGPLDS